MSIIARSVTGARVQFAYKFRFLFRQVRRRRINNRQIEFCNHKILKAMNKLFCNHDLKAIIDKTAQNEHEPQSIGDSRLDFDLLGSYQSSKIDFDSWSFRTDCVLLK